jgi:hypothetical protein
MKIIIVGSVESDSLESNLKDAFLETGGLEIGSVNWPLKVHFRHFGFLGKLISLQLRQKIVLRLIEFRLVMRLKKSKPDLIIVCTGAARLITPLTLEKISDFTKKIFCWYVDSSRNLTDNLLFAKYDHIYFTDRGLFDYLSPILRTRSSSLLLEGFHDRRHVSGNSQLRGDYIAVVGSYYPERILLLEHLVGMGFPLKLYGFRLPRSYGDGLLKRYEQSEYLTYENKSRVFEEARCVLNNFNPEHIDAVNCRVFEAMASGALLVSQESPLLLETFQSGKELLTFKSFDQLESLLEAIFDGRYDEKAIREAAILAVRGHTLITRAKSILEDFANL